MKSRLAVWDAVERAQAEVAASITRGKLPVTKAAGKPQEDGDLAARRKIVSPGSREIAWSSGGMEH
jgi:hypothetical protein